MITVIKNGINPTLDQYDYPEKILEIANNKDVNTIVIGSRGLSTAKEFLLGSVSHKITHHAKCSVVIVR
jgi:nucleotide-binding universal stress UspA family protein